MINLFNKKINIFSILIIIFIFFSCAKTSFASTEIYFHKDLNQIIKGDTFAVDLKISSSDDLINVIDGTIIYDKNILEVVNINTNNSLISLWVTEPTFDNKIGELKLVGGIPNGFKGENGQIFEIIFKAKRTGVTLIGFKDIFSVFINDGLGTAINPWLKPISLYIDQKSLSAKNVLNDVLNQTVNPNNNRIYFVSVFVLISIFIIIKLLIKLKRNDK